MVPLLLAPQAYIGYTDVMCVDAVFMSYARTRQNEFKEKGRQWQPTFERPNPWHQSNPPLQGTHCASLQMSSAKVDRKNQL